MLTAGRDSLEFNVFLETVKISGNKIKYFRRHLSYLYSLKCTKCGMSQSPNRFHVSPRGNNGTERGSVQESKIESFKILRRERLRVRDFLSTKQCTRVSQRHFGGKTWQPSSFYYEFQRECRSSGNKLSNVRSFIILPSGEGATSFTKGNSANFSSEKW